MIARIKRRAKQRVKQYRRGFTIRYGAGRLFFGIGEDGQRVDLGAVESLTFASERWPRGKRRKRSHFSRIRLVVSPESIGLLSDDFAAQYTSDTTTGSAH